MQRKTSYQNHNNRYHHLFECQNWITDESCHASKTIITRVKEKKIRERHLHEITKRCFKILFAFFFIDWITNRRNVTFSLIFFCSFDWLCLAANLAWRENQFSSIFRWFSDFVCQAMKLLANLNQFAS